MRKLDNFSLSFPDLNHFDLKILLIEAEKKAALSMFTEYARDLIHPTNNDSSLCINEVDIEYKVLGLKSVDGLRFILEDHLFNGAILSSVYNTSARSFMR